MDSRNGNPSIADSTTNHIEWPMEKLQDELRRRKLSTTGMKHELIERLEFPVEDNTQEKLPGSPTQLWSLLRHSAPTQPRSRISIWNSPLFILIHFVLYLSDAVADATYVVATHLHIFFIVLVFIGSSVLLYMLDGQHQEWVGQIESSIIWYGWWIGLGITSSVGLGTGLHTFMLFLAPFIAQATLVAYSCHSLEFTTRGPNSFVCDSSLGQSTDPITVWSIASKVRLETLLWGFAAVAGQNDPEFASIERILDKPIELRNWSERTQIVMHSIVTNMGFFGNSALCISKVPNPLFDLAGIICGHFAVPLVRFLVRTMIGKSFIKSSIQSFAVIIVFSEDVQKTLLATLRQHAPYLHSPFESFFESQAAKFRKSCRSVNP
ncbi:hypothetical protein BASA83_006913 [Batrachochytrium salamandrivorans]|nr:hypothetical protein BASA83_006913 [Batrachochytrium salamandrivorans]